MKVLGGREEAGTIAFIRMKQNEEKETPSRNVHDTL